MTSTDARRASWLRAAACCWLVAAPMAAQEPAESASDEESQSFDVVFVGARVIDPETGLDAVRDVGVTGDRIAAVSASPLGSRLGEGGVLIDGRGKVLAPGFVDLHAHGQSAEANEYQVRDGVTTALELEWGYPAVGAWLEARRGRSRVHYGASASHGMLRSLLTPSLAAQRDEVEASFVEVSRESDPLRSFQGAVAESFYEAVPPQQFAELAEILDHGLAEGALGIGMAHQYFPGATRAEILSVFELAAARSAPIFTHVRSMGVDAIQEVLANAAVTGAPLHIVHLNSSSMDDLPTTLRLIGHAQRRGLDVTTEAYPYTAGSTGLQSAIFDPGWQQRLGIDYGDLQWQDTGERLTAESFERYRAEGGTVILHFMREEMIELAMATPFVIVASDGMPFAPGAHPRSAGTFSRVLGRYVRERGVLTLADAIARMSYHPARRLEAIAPQMRRKGRVQVGADADLVLFDPDTVIDTATFEEGLAFSRGIEQVLVAGELVVRDGATQEVFPGRPVRSRYADAAGD